MLGVSLAMGLINGLMQRSTNRLQDASPHEIPRPDEERVPISQSQFAFNTHSPQRPPSRFVLPATGSTKESSHGPPEEGRER